ncbi:MAG: hypothetical protein J7L96_02115, partial [Bacteroidales bacterium]|nr:hypothetical protein [Bacteroidales bacterium]
INIHTSQAVSSYDKGLNSRLCIYLTDTLSSWLQLAESLNAQGIPIRITQSLDDALEHQIVIIYPEITSNDLDLESFRKLKDFPVNGGVLIGFKPQAPSLQGIFGYKTYSKDLYREKITFNDQIENSLQLAPNEGNPGIVQISSKVYPIETIGYSNLDYQPLAEYEDGSAAIVQKIYNAGATYAMGFDPAELAIVRKIIQGKPKNYLVNIYNQPVDIFFWLVKKIFQNHSKYAVYLGTVPNFKTLPIIITHTIDSRSDLKASAIYDNLETNNNIKTSYFIQTKYVKDYEGSAFFIPENIPYLRSLSDNGMEIASTGVSNSPFFGYLYSGTGLESYPDYRPMITSETSGFNETLMGELQVSKFLLEHYLRQQRIQSFSSPRTKINDYLYSGMESAGYQFSTCTPAAQVQTYLPYLNQDQVKGNSIGKILEIPVTLNSKDLIQNEDVLSTTVFKLINIEQFGGVAVIAIEPSPEKNNLEYELMLINHYIDDAWFGTIAEYGEWWNARHLIELDVEPSEDFIFINLFSPVQINNLPLCLPLDWQYIGVQPQNTEMTGNAQGILIKSFKGRLRLGFKAYSNK